MAAVTFAMMVDFSFFREQMCLIACPYGRFQSVLLDNNSLIVSYDQQRGENRGRKPKGPTSESLPVIGDCVDCGNCVTTCPTGIDIRDGLQMECINCTQCIDACNIVMKKLGREPDLIRYSSESRDAGERAGLLRARTMIYPILLTAIGTAFVFALMSVKTFDAFMVREPGNPFTYTAEGQVRNLFNLKITSRSEKAQTLTATIQNPSGAVLEIREEELVVTPGEAKGFHLGLIVPREAFVNGLSNATILLESDDGVQRILEFDLVGPYD
jgi:cytochrome c oxidase accessory protein FixG